MKHHLQALPALFLFSLTFISFNLHAQFTEYTFELDTVFTEEGNALQFFGTYKVYANFTNSEDILSALYSDVGALGTPEMFIDAPCGCHDPVATSMSMDASNSSLFWPVFPEMEYDTYWTIGMTSADDPGILPSTVGMPTEMGICSSVFDNGSVYMVGSPENAVAGDDLKILIAQVTTCGDWSLQTCLQSFVGGEQTNINTVCPELLEVSHLYNNGECVNDSDNDGICDELEIIGCIDLSACNFDPEATDGSGGCDYSCYGCTDDLSCNFDSGATLDDGSCEYLSCAGCMNPEACNYDFEATINDEGSCEYLSCAGCMNPEACNYDFEATINDSTCILPGDSCDDGDENTANDAIQAGSCECQGFGCNDSQACNYSPNALPDASLCNYITLFSISGEVNPTANILFSYSYPSTSGSNYVWASTSGDVTDGEGTSSVNVSWWGGGSGSLCVTETNNGGCSGDEVCLTIDITAVSIDEVEDGSFVVFPSPASSNVTVVLQNGIQSAELFVRDNSGRLIRRCSLQNETTLDVSELPRGAYIFQLNTQSETPTYRRIILN